MPTRTLTRLFVTLTLALAALLIVNHNLVTGHSAPSSQGSTITCLGSIQACIDAASDGDTIVIPAGTYTESLTLSKPVSLTGVNSSTTIIHAVANQRVLTVTGATISNSVVISGLTFTGGTADYGGGVIVTDAAQLWLLNVTIFNNYATADGGGLHASSAITFTNVNFISNTSVGSGGGAYLDGAAALTSTNFVSNTAHGKVGGGVSIALSALVAGGRFEANVCLSVACSGGGLSVLNTFPHTATVTISGTHFMSNYATAAGGAVGLLIDGSSAIINTLFARNHADWKGAALFFGGNQQSTIVHSTIAGTGNPEEAIAAVNTILHVTNTIITSHTIGIEFIQNGGLSEDYNLFFSNITNTVGAITGSHSQIGDPRFVDPLHDDYHLRFGSPAIDHGIDAGVYTDLDGHPRPIGSGFDIGAYEYQGVIHSTYLPLMLK